MKRKITDYLIDILTECNYLLKESENLELNVVPTSSFTLKRAHKQ